MQQPVLSVNKLSLKFNLPGNKTLRAVQDVSFSVQKGHTLGLVGESGCGKSSLARALLRLYEPESGEVLVDGENILTADKKRVFEVRRKIQMVFQDPFASLDPRQTIGDAIMEPMRIYRLANTGAEYEKRCASLLEKVGLSGKLMRKFPHEFSGGQLQRVGIARALALSPQIIVADEPVSALDVSVQAQVVNLLKQLQRELGIAIVFIAHDLSIVRHMADEIAVMYLGRIVEHGESEQVCQSPSHPYTRMLIDSIPNPDPQLANKFAVRTAAMELPSPLKVPAGCPFHTRCGYVKDVCKSSLPSAVKRQDGREVRCHDPR